MPAAAAAKNMDNIVRGLTHMKEKQLLAVEHLLRPAPGVMDDIAIAAKLPRSNQVSAPLC